MTDETCSYPVGDCVHRESDEIVQLRAERQTFKQNISFWKHEAERFKEALTLAQQDVKRVTNQRDQCHVEIARIDGERNGITDTSARVQELESAIKFALSEIGDGDNGPPLYYQQVYERLELALSEKLCAPGGQK